MLLIGALPAVSVPARAAWEGSPDYQQAIVNEQAAGHAIDLAKAKKWDDFSAGILAEGERTEDEPDGLSNTGLFGVRITVPLPVWNQNQGEVIEKIAGALRARRETVALAVTISNEAEAARSLMVANLLMVLETRDKLIPMSAEQTDKLEKAYKTGQVEMLIVLRAREQRLQLDTAMLDASRDFHLARIRYEAATSNVVRVMDEVL